MRRRAQACGTKISEELRSFVAGMNVMRLLLLSLLSFPFHIGRLENGLELLRARTYNFVSIINLNEEINLNKNAMKNGSARWALFYNTHCISWLWTVLCACACALYALSRAINKLIFVDFGSFSIFHGICVCVVLSEPTEELSYRMPISKTKVHS